MSDPSKPRSAGMFQPQVSTQPRPLMEGQHRQGAFQAKVLTLEPGTYQYRYIVDGEWQEDPANPQSAPGPTGQPNSILHVR